jgi:hypothetical protein
VIWEPGLMGLTPLLTISQMYGINSYMNSEVNSKTLTNSDDPK